MADFRYKVIDAAGREKEGRVQASDEAAARAELARRKFYVVKVERGTGEANEPGLFQLKRTKLNGKQLALFTRQLATITQVSPLEEALRTISRQSEQPHVRSIVSSVHGGVLEGRLLSDSMGLAAKSFPPLYRAMVSAGELSGSLPEILERLADLLERQAATRAKILTALAYPIILSLVAVGVVIALMMFVVPKVVEQFEDVGQQLPLLTRIVIGISDGLANYWWLIMLIVAGLIALAIFALRQPEIRYRFDAMLLKTPLLGRLIRDLHAARLSRTLATMVSSRLPLLEGLRLTTPTIHNRVLREASENIVDQVRGGGSLSAGLRSAGVFPPLLVYLAASGESSGRLEIMLERAADYLEREFDSFTATALSLLEPAIIVVMGGIVAAIILSILLPILQLQNLAGI